MNWLYYIDDLWLLFNSFFLKIRWYFVLKRNYEGVNIAKKRETKHKINLTLWHNLMFKYSNFMLKEKFVNLVYTCDIEVKISKTAEDVPQMNRSTCIKFVYTRIFIFCNWCCLIPVMPLIYETPAYSGSRNGGLYKWFWSKKSHRLHLNVFNPRQDCNWANLLTLLALFIYFA